MLFAGSAHAQGSFNFQGARISMVLDVYSQLSGKQLVIESSATNQLKTITVKTTAAVTKEEAIKTIESALHKQADIVIAPLDDKRASVKLVQK